MSGKYCIRINLERIKTICHPKIIKRKFDSVPTPNPQTTIRRRHHSQQRLQALPHPPREENPPLRTHYQRPQRHLFNLRGILGSKRRELHRKKRGNIRHYRQKRQRKKHFAKDRSRRINSRFRQRKN